MRIDRRSVLPPAEAAPESNPPSIKPLAELLKEQFFLLTSLVLMVGIASTDAYYATFSLGYQFLDVPANHLLYRGVTMLAGSWWLLLCYAAAVAWLLVDDTVARGNSWYQAHRVRVSCLSVIAVLAITFPLARLAGIRAAHRDLGPRSTLPRINRLVIEGETINLKRGYRLLMMHGNSVVVFKPVESLDGGELPNIRQFSRQDIKALETLPNAAD